MDWRLEILVDDEHLVVRNSFNEGNMCFSLKSFSLFFVYLHIYGFSSSLGAPYDLVDITWIKGKCLIQKVSKKV